jgi:hypothetical protein
VGYARGIFPLVILNDAMLLAFFDVLPIRLEGDIKDGIAVEH